MTSPNQILLTLLVLLRRSFVQYLRYAHPYGMPAKGETADVLADLLADQDVLAARVTERLEAAGAAVPNIEFPLSFTDTNDLSIEFLIERAIRHTRQDLAKLEGLGDSLALQASLRSLVDEAKGMLQSHLESLQELAAVKS